MQSWVYSNVNIVVFSAWSPVCSSAFGFLFLIHWLTRMSWSRHSFFHGVTYMHSLLQCDFSFLSELPPLKHKTPRSLRSCSLFAPHKCSSSVSECQGCNSVHVEQFKFTLFHVWLHSVWLPLCSHVLQGNKMSWNTGGSSASTTMMPTFTSVCMHQSSKIGGITCGVAPVLTTTMLPIFTWPGSSSILVGPCSIGSRAHGNGSSAVDQEVMERESRILSVSF